MLTKFQSVFLAPNGNHRSEFLRENLRLF